MPDGVKYCPHCGTPTPLAPIDAEKGNSATPPPVPPTNEPQPESPSDSATPPPHYHTPHDVHEGPAEVMRHTSPHKVHRRRFTWAVVAAGAAVAIILLIFIALYLKEHTQVTIKRTVSTQSIPINATGQADVDSIFQIMMQQSDQQLAMMDSMERAFMGDIDIDTHQSQATQGAKQRQSGSLAMTGTIGQQECLLHLNIADPQNVKGSARFVMKGKPGIPMKLIGLTTGDGTLTVSIYKGEEIAGTLVGRCDGMTYEGSFTSSSSSKEIPFSFKATQ